MKTPPAFAIVGWKNSGKSTLVAKLISHFAAQGLKVGAIKHAHHAFEIDHAGTDSHRHRQAGACKIVLASSKRIAEIEEFDPEIQVNLDDLFQRFLTYDLVICEGFKHANIAKIEIVSSESKPPFLFENDPNIFAIACDFEVSSSIPQFARNGVAAIATFISEKLNLS